jgi:hypothetical protein
MCDTVARIVVVVLPDDIDFSIYVSMTLTGSLIPATFHDDVDDNREIDVTDIKFDEDYIEYDTCDFKEKVYNYVNYHLPRIFNEVQRDSDLIFLPHRLKVTG